MAIKIIKPGKKPDTVKRFTCSHCGCVFMAGMDDYEKVYSLCNGYYLRVDCPVCERTVRRPCDE